MGWRSAIDDSIHCAFLPFHTVLERGKDSNQISGRQICPCKRTPLGRKTFDSHRMHHLLSGILVLLEAIESKKGGSVLERCSFFTRKTNLHHGHTTRHGSRGIAIHASSERNQTWTTSEAVHGRFRNRHARPRDLGQGLPMSRHSSFENSSIDLPFVSNPEDASERSPFSIPSVDAPWKSHHSSPLGFILGRTASLFFRHEGIASLDKNTSRVRANESVPPRRRSQETFLRSTFADAEESKRVRIVRSLSHVLSKRCMAFSCSSSSSFASTFVESIPFSCVDLIRMGCA